MHQNTQGAKQLVPLTIQIGVTIIVLASCSATCSTENTNYIYTSHLVLRFVFSIHLNWHVNSHNTKRLYQVISTDVARITSVVHLIRNKEVDKKQLPSYCLLASVGRKGQDQLPFCLKATTHTKQFKSNIVYIYFGYLILNNFMTYSSKSKLDFFSRPLSFMSL